MFKIDNRIFKNRLLLGTSRYPTGDILKKAIERSSAEIVTVSMRRSSGSDAQRFWEIIQTCNVSVLPNTAGCRTAKEAVATAHLARELFSTNWIKLETVGDENTLQPDPFELLESATILIKEGFEVFPYTTDDLVVAERLVSAGCKILMPLASPIGSGQGLINPAGLQLLRKRFPQIRLIVDAGIGAPSHAAQVMELGFDAILLNSAVALAHDPIAMAEAFSLAIQAGRQGYEAGLMPKRSLASHSTPTFGTPFWHLESTVCP